MPFGYDSKVNEFQVNYVEDEKQGLRYGNPWF